MHSPSLGAEWSLPLTRHEGSVRKLHTNEMCVVVAENFIMSELMKEALPL